MTTGNATRPLPVLLKTVPDHASVWRDIFAAEAPHLDLQEWETGRSYPGARFAAVWQPPVDLMNRAPDLDLVFSVAAGLDHLPLDRVPGHVTVTRMIAEDMTRSMVEYVTWAVLTLHRDLHLYLGETPAGHWNQRMIRRARERTVGFMGLGVLGSSAATALAGMGFDVRGWSRRPKTLQGVSTHAGASGLSSFLKGCEILVCMLPLTDETTGILDRTLFNQLPAGAMLVNVGRGAHLVEADMLAALEAGSLSGAVLDVLASEPPPAGHPLCEHPRVLVTPHTASVSQPDAAARQMIRAVDAVCRGDRPDNTVER